MKLFSLSKSIAIDIVAGFFSWAFWGNISFTLLLFVCLLFSEKFDIDGFLIIIIVSWSSTIISMIILLFKKREWVSFGIAVAIFINFGLWVLWLGISPDLYTYKFAAFVATCPLPAGILFMIVLPSL